MTGPELAAVVLAVVAGAAVQAVSGLGFALVAVPVLAAVVPERLPQLVLLLVAPVLLGALLTEHGSIDRPTAWWMSVGKLLGTAPGTLLVTALPVRGLQLLFAVVTGVSAVVIACARRPVETGVGGQLLAGAVSGVTATAAGIGGPPLALVLAGRDGPEVRSTLSAVIAVGNAFSLGGLALAGRLGAADLRLAALLSLPLGLGFVLGGRLRGRVDAARLRALLALLVAAGATALAVEALIG